jgi:hypothetical protein
VRQQAPHLVAAVHAVARRPARRGRHALHPQPIERIVGVAEAAAVALSERGAVADGVVAPSCADSSASTACRQPRGSTNRLLDKSTSDHFSIACWVKFTVDQCASDKI